MNNKLYVTVTMKNEAGVTPRGSTALSASVSVRSRPASIISLANLIANVKDDTGDLVKYIPDQMLTEKQCDKKKVALARDEKRIRDMRYEFAVQQGNDEKTGQYTMDTETFYRLKGIISEISRLWLQSISQTAVLPSLRIISTLSI